jgi:hypothetical protein
MNGAADMGGAGTYGNTEADEAGALDPESASRLLTQTQRQAQRSLDFRSPWLTLIAAAVALIAFGAVWLSVREQHPFKGPTAAALVVLYALVAIRIGTAVRQQRAEGVALVAALVAVYLPIVSLAQDGAGHASFYWVYAVTATLIVLGAFWAGRSAVREDWMGLGVSVAVMLVGAVSALAGPRGMWLSDGIGLCVVLLGYTAVEAGLVHAPRSGT